MSKNILPSLTWMNLKGDKINAVVVVIIKTPFWNLKCTTYLWIIPQNIFTVSYSTSLSHWAMAGCAIWVSKSGFDDDNDNRDDIIPLHFLPVNPFKGVFFSYTNNLFKEPGHVTTRWGRNKRSSKFLKFNLRSKLQNYNITKFQKCQSEF